MDPKKPRQQGAPPVTIGFLLCLKWQWPSLANALEGRSPKRAFQQYRPLETEEQVKQAKSTDGQDHAYEGRSAVMRMRRYVERTDCPARTDHTHNQTQDPQHLLPLYVASLGC
jgi:hypothetical protein